MNHEPRCPFYGRSPEQCDVGFGYISPYHVEVMVRHCLSHYEGCGRYRSLSSDDPPGREGRKVQHPPADTPAGGLALPLVLDREVASTVQHALRTPLTSIRSFSEILLNHPVDDPEAQRRFLQIIHDEAQRLSRAMDSVFGKPGVVRAKEPEAADR